MTAISVVLWSVDPARSAMLQNALLADPGLSAVAITLAIPDPNQATTDAALCPTALHLLIDTEALQLRLYLMQLGVNFTVLWGSPEEQIAAAITAIQFARSSRETTPKSELKTPQWQWHCPHCSDPAGEAHALHVARGLRALINNTADPSESQMATQNSAT